MKLVCKAKEDNMPYLKKIELDDLQELSTMLKDFWKTQQQDVSKGDILEDLRRLLEPKCVSYLIMSDDKQIAGFIYVNDKYGYVNNIEYLYIKDTFRGQVLGSFALLEIKQILMNKGNERVQIEVMPSNTKALKLYHHLGFDSIDTFTLSTKLPGKTKQIELMGFSFKIND